jgi:hypothetical protein
MAYFRERFRTIFKVKDSPHRIALAFAIGVFWGMSPLLGFHTIGAFLTAWIFSLNRLVAIAGVCVGNPWTLVPIYTFCLWLGAKLTGMKQIIPDINWNDISFIYLLTKLQYLLKPFIVGSTIVATIAGIASYFIIHILIKRYKEIRNAA